MNILFVCSGNVSRSFLAEMLLRYEISKKDLEGISVSSAGLFASPGSPADPEMLSYLLREGIPVLNHRARQIEEKDVAWADRIYVMERRQGEIVEETWPDAKGKIKHLGALISAPPYMDDIVDPFGRSPYYYRLSQSQISLAVKRLVDCLLRRGINPSA
ncbi:MAG: hypothetical protein JRJ29_01815 [Deltaproteobacteria bacterium]|nr:hypothetical protein [Deltaproteobacteria bacterium]